MELFVIPSTLIKAPKHHDAACMHHCKDCVLLIALCIFFFFCFKQIFWYYGQKDHLWSQLTIKQYSTIFTEITLGGIECLFQFRSCNNFPQPRHEEFGRLWFKLILGGRPVFVMSLWGHISSTCLLLPLQCFMVYQKPWKLVITLS